MLWRSAPFFNDEGWIGADDQGRHDRGAMGIFTRTGGTIAFFCELNSAVESGEADVLQLRWVSHIRL